MPRSNWKGIISFGLVNIPIILFNSEETSEKVSFHQIDKRNNARIKYQRINSETGKEVPWENIVRGYQYDKETVIPVNDDELLKIAGENSRTIAIENFINQTEINPIDIYKTYYLLPDKNGEKGYVILREALQHTKKTGIARVIISTKEYVAAVTCFKETLILYLLHYTNEIKPLSDFEFPDNNLKKCKITKKELDIANQLINSMTVKWKPEKYRDNYFDIVQKWAENKIKHKKVITHQSTKIHTNNVVDFVDLLRKSLGKSKVQAKPTKKKKHAA